MVQRGSGVQRWMVGVWGQPSAEAAPAACGMVPCLSRTKRPAYVPFSRVGTRIME